MPHICIISSSIRPQRNSHRVALYFKKYLEENNLATVEILDLKEYNFPIFDNKLKDQKNPTPQTLEFAQKIKDACGVIMVTPEYNGGYPASLKNVVDVLYEEWKHKPIAIATVSAGAFGGSQVITSLQFSLWKIMAWTVPAAYHVAKVTEAYDAEGNTTNKEATDKLAHTFIKELLWCISAHKAMQPSTVF